jgi:hypothetical protein
MSRLTSEEIEHLVSLDDSEQAEFFQILPPEQVQAIADQIASESSQTPTALDSYSADRSARNAAVINAKTAASQEIGPLPDVADPQRRERASADNLYSAETYFPATFYLGWAPYQRVMMDRFQDAVFTGGKECHAVRRGGLKSTCARVSAIWAAINGHLKFPVLVGATDDKSKEHRENLFSLLASSDLLLQDYPELMPLMLKWKQPKKQFRLDGRLLTLSHKDERGRIVFPDIHDAPSCQTHIAPYSVNATDVSGLAYVDRHGVTIRPDGIFYDDVQTPQTAKSPLQTEELESRITKTFGGLKGLGQRMAEVMVCTVREHDDLTERFLDRKRHNDWNGKKYPSLMKLPERIDLWDRYAGLLGQGETPAVGLKLAHEFYALHQIEMDKGGKVAWDLDKQEDELTALQSMMTIRALDPEFFRKEIQQEGAAPVNTSGVKLSTLPLLNRLSHYSPGVVPELAVHQTAFVDSSDQVLWWMVCGWGADFSGWVIDYGTWPDQGRPVFYKSDLPAKISQQLPGVSWEEAFVHAHNELDAVLFERFPDLDLVLKDWSDGQHKPRIEAQVMSSVNQSRIRPSKGFAPKPGRKPVHLWGDQHRDRHNGSNWVERRTDRPHHVQFDANQWKTFAARRLMTTVGAPSAMVLPGSEEYRNRLLVEHLTAENPKHMTYDGASGVVWEQPPGRDNDWFDTLVGNAVAASMLGCGLNGEKPSANRVTRTFALPGRR